MTKSFSKIVDLLSIIYKIRERYIASLSDNHKTKHLPLPRSSHLNIGLFPHMRKLAFQMGIHRKTGQKHFEVIKSLSENHFKIKLCLNNQNDYLFRYASNYYKKKLSLHAFYNWKMAKLFAIGSTLRKKTYMPRTGTLNQVANLSKFHETKPDNEAYNSYFKKFERFRFD